MMVHAFGIYEYVYMYKHVIVKRVINLRRAADHYKIELLQIFLRLLSYTFRPKQKATK